jgi:hypothetical protein
VDVDGRSHDPGTAGDLRHARLGIGSEGFERRV